MRVTGLQVERFLGFQWLDIDFDGSLQVIAGPNNAGKSSIVRLLEAFFSVPTGGELADLQPRHDYYREGGPAALSSITVWFEDFSASEREEFNSHIRRNDGRMWVTVRVTRGGGKVTYKASGRASGDQAEDLYRSVVERVHFVKIPSVRVGDTGGNDHESMTRLMDTLEAILIRRVPGPRTAIQREFQSRMKAVTDLVQEVFDGSAAAIVNELPFQERQVGFRLPGHSEAIKGMLSSTVIESHGAVSLPVSERGTGFQSALVLGILRYVAQRESRSGTHLFFAVEEPEAFLHPQTQRAMAQVLRQVAEDAQLLVTTHSPVLVDSFRIDKVARLPLQQGGTTFEWSPPTLDTAEEGRLTRYCTAANSELVFASTVIFVEGVGDKDVIDLMLGDIYNAVGGHYAHGVSVIAAEGLTNIKHLVSLAELFGVQSYVLSDKDGLHGERDLLKVLSGRPQKLPPDVRVALIGAVDNPTASIESALQQQAAVNALLEASGAFILSSDLEGLLLDALGVPAIIEAIGPQGEGSIDTAFAGRLDDQSDDDAYATLGGWLGTKGWNSDRRRTGKMKPHLAPLLYRKIESPSENPVIAPLRDWLERITSGTTTAPL